MNHLSKLENSTRLQKFCEFLRQRGAQGATGAEIFANTGVYNPGEARSSCERNGVIITCAYEGKSNGRKIFRYTFVRDTRTEKVAA